MAVAASQPKACDPDLRGQLRFLAGLAPDAALGRAVAHLMTRPAFGAAPFGHLARALTGQVNRGHYAFACDGSSVVGFAGWALTDTLLAEAWLEGRPLADGEALRGDCLVLNFWQADTPTVSRFLLRELGSRLSDIRRIYAKRHYPDGRMRPARLSLRGTGGRFGGEPVPFLRSNAPRRSTS